MNYRHAYHAGNFADVVKHVALVAVLLHLRKKPTPFAVIDSHAGRGLYDLASEEAKATDEAQGGIVRLGGLDGAGVPAALGMPAALGEYLRIVRETVFYPGSPVIAAKLLRPQDRLVAIEKHPGEADALGAALAPFAGAHAEHADGAARLIALLPPPERRGIIVVDPPFEAAERVPASAAQLLRAAYRRFATGIYLSWFPVKSAGSADTFCGEVLNCGATRILRIDIDIAPGAAKIRDAERLTRAGLLVLNPPYGLAGQMREILDLLEPLIKQGGGAQARIDWLAGGE